MGGEPFLMKIENFLSFVSNFATLCSQQYSGSSQQKMARCSDMVLTCIYHISHSSKLLFHVPHSRTPTFFIFDRVYGIMHPTKAEGIYAL